MTIAVGGLVGPLAALEMKCLDHGLSGHAESFRSLLTAAGPDRWWTLDAAARREWLNQLDLALDVRKFGGRDWAVSDPDYLRVLHVAGGLRRALDAGKV